MAHSEPPAAGSGAPPGTTPPVVFGDYLLERRLAVGGTSQVFLARRRAGGQASERLVIKRLQPAYLGDPQALGMFATEARLHRAVRHPNVVEVYEAGFVGDEPYLAMEHVEGVDLLRLMRRAQTESRPLPARLSVHVTRKLCEALECVHGALDEQGKPLGIIHRDLTPSNVYLSATGQVRLGDFGIAREQLKASRGSQNPALKGKYGYLSPEQVSGEAIDQRSDLFSLAVVCAELLINQPLFAGAGQLAVLLAIRDARIDALEAASSRLPAPLVAVLRRALSRDRAARFPTARSLGEALAPFEAGTGPTGAMLVREWVAWAGNTSDIARRVGGALVSSGDRMRTTNAPPPPPPRAAAPSDELLRPSAAPELLESLDAPFEHDEAEPVTARFDEVPSHVRPRGRREARHVAFARIIQMIVTGELGPDDEVDLMGQGFRRVADIELLERHLPDAATTRTLQAPSPPDEAADLGPDMALLGLLGRLSSGRETGLLLVEGRPSPDEAPARREIYLQEGLLLHVASADAGDLLGQNLVRRGVLSASELDMALAVLSRFEGRLGDTLIALGLVDAVEIFRAIEEQGRERLSRLFSWTGGRASFYRGVRPSRVEFPLELDLPPLMLAGLSLSMPNDTPVVRARELLTRTLKRAPGQPAPAQRKALPRAITVLYDALGASGMELRHMLMRLSTTGLLSAADALRAMHVGLAVGLFELS